MSCYILGRNKNAEVSEGNAIRRWLGAYLTADGVQNKYMKLSESEICGKR